MSGGYNMLVFPQEVLFDGNGIVFKVSNDLIYDDQRGLVFLLSMNEINVKKWSHISITIDNEKLYYFENICLNRPGDNNTASSSTIRNNTIHKKNKKYDEDHHVEVDDIMTTYIVQLPVPGAIEYPTEPDHKLFNFIADKEIKVQFNVFHINDKFKTNYRSSMCYKNEFSFKFQQLLPPEPPQFHDPHLNQWFASLLEPEHTTVTSITSDGLDLLSSLCSLQYTTPAPDQGVANTEVKPPEVKPSEVKPPEVKPPPLRKIMTEVPPTDEDPVASVEPVLKRSRKSDNLADMEEMWQDLERSIRSQHTH